MEIDLILVVDDLHWADRSTLELLTFVAPRLGDARVVLVGAYRSDELHRRHPLRPVLIELEHAGSLAHLRLGPLSPEDVAAQLEAITGTALPPASLARIVELADGNPFYVEELAALNPDGTRLPPSLRELLAARLGRLSDATLDVLAGAAVIGRDVDPELLAAVVDASGHDVRAGLAEAAQHQVIEPTRDGRRYRIPPRAARRGDPRRPAPRRTDRPAPTTRGGAHDAAGARCGVARWRGSGGRPPLDRGGRSGTSDAAWIEAGRSAGAAQAWQESASAYEQALSLAAAEPASLEPGQRADLGLRAAMMTSFAGDPRRAFELAVVAIAADDGSDPVAVGTPLDGLRGMANDVGEFEQERLAADRSMELMPTEPPSIDVARVLVGHVSSQMLRGSYRAAVAEADQALRVCLLVGDRDGELEVLRDQGHVPSHRSVTRMSPCRPPSGSSRRSPVTIAG